MVILKKSHKICSTQNNPIIIRLWQLPSKINLFAPRLLPIFFTTACSISHSNHNPTCLLSMFFLRRCHTQKNLCGEQFFNISKISFMPSHSPFTAILLLFVPVIFSIKKKALNFSFYICVRETGNTFLISFSSQPTPSSSPLHGYSALRMTFDIYCLLFLHQNSSS